jgi:Ca-activated chloride channel family protein
MKEVYRVKETVEAYIREKREQSGKRLLRLSVLVFLTGFLLFAADSSAQEEKKYVREGNKSYDKGQYKEAEDQYHKALDLNPGNFKGGFNLGDAYYKEGKNKEAAAKFEELTKATAGDDVLSAKAYHNLGNALMKDKKYEESVAAYKKALTLNPKDDDTRYNLAYAQQMLIQKQNKDKKENKDNKDKKDDKDKNKDKDKKEDKNKKDKKDNKDKDKEKPGDKDKQKPDPGKQDKDQQNRVSKGAAQKMLNEVNNNERKVQNKLKKQKESVQSVKIEKDW